MKTVRWDYPKRLPAKRPRISYAGVASYRAWLRCVVRLLDSN